MNTGAEMPNITQKKEKSNHGRGRPPRHESERLRTIAWYHFLADDMSPAEMCDWPALREIDQATIYRYRRGDISPGSDILNAEDELFRAALNVYQIGPMQVPLWDAMWGSITPADFRLADRLMPGGSWPQGWLSQYFFDDAVLARIIDFQNECLPRGDVEFTSQLEVFCTALRIFRAWRLLGQVNSSAFQVLLEGTMALPGARMLLERHGLIKPLQGWINSQFQSVSSPDRSTSYWAPWMGDDEEFSRKCIEAEELRQRMRGDLLTGLFRTVEKGFVDDLMIGEAEGDTWH